MKNSFKEFIQKRKMVFVSAILLTFFISALVKKIKPKENLSNFIFYFIAIPVIFSLLCFLIDYLIKIRKERKDQI